MEIGKKRVRRRFAEDAADKALYGSFIDRVGIGPTRDLLAFANRFNHVGLNPFGEAADRGGIVGGQSWWPDSDESLVEQVFDIAVGDEFPVDFRLVAPG